MHGAECYDGINGFRCRCAPGFYGALCQFDYDECASSPCVAGATCVNLVNGYRCDCPPGVSDATCSRSSHDTSSSPTGCRSSPCLNGATCVDARRPDRWESGLALVVRRLPMPLPVRIFRLALPVLGSCQRHRGGGGRSFRATTDDRRRSSFVAR
jgi:hypothetical protein